MLGSVPVAGVTCDDCSGNVSFVAHFENDLDVTKGDPCGCSDGDTTLELTGATFSTDAEHTGDGLYGLYCANGTDYAKVENTSRNILTEVSGTIKFWIYITTWVSGTKVFFTEYGTSSDYLRLTMAGGSNSDIEFTLRQNDTEVPNKDAPTTELDGDLNTWYYIVVKWRNTGDPNLFIGVYSDEVGTLFNANSYASNNTDLAAWGGEPDFIEIGNNSSNAAAFYIDKFYLSKAYE
jgi:hypothetical protein